MRKRLATLVMSITAAAVLLPATPASATSCVILPDPEVGDVLCLIYSEPAVRFVCDKTVLC